MTTVKVRAIGMLLLGIFFSLLVVNAQRRPAEKTASHNFYEIEKKYEEQFRKPRKQPAGENEKDNDETKFRRFQMFWQPRVDEKGNFSTYYQNLKKTTEELGCTTCNAACNKSNWDFLGPASLPTQNMGAIMSVWVNPANPQEILAGTYSAGLYKTTNGGGNWTRAKFGCKVNCPDFPSGGVSSIAVDPANPNTMYISLGVNRELTETYSYGVYKSTDGGLTWCATDLVFAPTEYVRTTKVIMDPSNSNTLFAVADNNIYKTTNGGASWKANVIITAAHPISDIAVSRNAGSAGLFVAETGERCLYNGCPMGSDWNCPLENGKIWYDTSFNGISTSTSDITTQALGFSSSPNTEVRMEKALFAVTSNSVSILSLSDSHACPLALTQDKIVSRNVNVTPTLATSWATYVDPPGSYGSAGASFGTGFAVSPLNDSLVLIGSDSGGSFPKELFVSNTGGANFSLNKACLHADLRAMAFARKDSTTGNEFWIVGNDGGVAEAPVNAASATGPCKNLNGSDLTVTDFFGLSNSEIDPSRIYAGSQDNGIFNNTIGTWAPYPWFDAYDSVSDATNANRAYATTPGGFIQTNDGTNWGGLSWPIPAETRLLNSPMVVDKSNALYVGQTNVWRIYPSATTPTWSNLGPGTSGKLRALHVPPLNSSIIIAAKDGVTYGGTGQEKLYRTDTAHLNSIPTGWLGITYNLPIQWQLITGITSDEQGNNLWVSMGNFGRHVLLLEKGKTTWTDMSQGLPNLPVNVIRYWEGSNDDSLFVGTDTGVYYRNKNMKEWKRISCGLPNLLVSDLEINNRTQKIRVATRGGGIWETSLSSIRSQGCSTDSSLSVSYTRPSGPTTKDFQNNSIVTDALGLTQVSVTPKTVCCVEPCDKVANYTWKLYRVPYPVGGAVLIGGGQNSPANFLAEYEMPPLMMHKRFNYKVEVTGSCDDKNCPTLTIQFKRW